MESRHQPRPGREDGDVEPATGRRTRHRIDLGLARRGRDFKRIDDAGRRSSVYGAARNRRTNEGSDLQRNALGRSNTRIRYGCWHVTWNVYRKPSASKLTAAGENFMKTKLFLILMALMGSVAH